MSKIVKASAVVDDRPPMRKTLGDVIEAELGNMSVIKRQIFSYRENPYSDPKLILPDKQGYIDELNRIKVEIEQAKAELRSLGRQLEEAAAPEESVEEEVIPDSESGAGVEMDAEMITKAAAEEARKRLSAAQAECGNMLRETKNNIDVMMNAASEEGKRLAEEAKNNGYLEGFDSGFAQALNEFKGENEPKIKQLDRLLEQLSNYREEMLAQSERDLVALVLSVAKKILGREIKDEPRSIAHMLYQELDQNRREENLRVTISQELMPVEAKVTAEIKKMIVEAAPGALIYVDENAERGTIYIESDKGITDLSVDTQLENVGKLLEEN